MSPRRRKENKIAGLEKLHELDPELARQLLELIQSKELLNNRYRLIGLLDKGGFGLIFTAEDINMSRIVAIKVLHNLNNDKRRRQFNLEATILGNLQHPVLPAIFDRFSEGDLQFLVMEYIKGEDLGKLLKRKMIFTVQEVLRWADELLDALNYLHNQSEPIIHRDIKPANIILTKEGKIFLLDFGLAKGEADSTLLLSETRVRTASILAFTLSYAPLEQLNGAGTDVQSDIFALAATLYHLLTGQLPCKTAAERWREFGKNGRDPLPTVHELNPAVPIQLSDVVAQAMAINPKDRFASAAEMRDRLAIVRAEITKLGQEKEETTLKFKDKSIPEARESTRAEKRSVARSLSPEAEQNENFSTFLSVADDDKLRTRKATHPSDEEALQQVIEVEAAEEVKEETRPPAEKAARQLAHTPSIRKPAASIAEQRANNRSRKLIMMVPMAALLVLSIAFAIIFIFNRRGTSTSTPAPSTAQVNANIAPNEPAFNTNTTQANATPVLNNTNSISAQRTGSAKQERKAPEPRKVPEPRKEIVRTARDLKNLSNALHRSDALFQPYQNVALSKRRGAHADFAVIHNNQGNDFAKSKKFQSAIKQYQSVIKQYQNVIRDKSNLAEAYFNLGNVLFELGRYDEAIKKYEQAVRYNQNLVAAYFNLGNAYAKLNKPNDAIKWYQQAIERKPDFPEAHLNLGNMYVAQNRLREAAEEYRIAIRYQKDLADAFFNQGLVHLYRGEKKAAMAQQETLRKLKSKLAAELSKRIQSSDV